MSNIKYQSLSNDFAIWAEGRENSYEIDLYINEWINPPENNYLDMGIRLYNVTTINNLYIYISYSILPNELCDLSNKFSDERIARGIFNSDCLITRHLNSSKLLIEYNERQEDVIDLSSMECTVSYADEYTLIGIPIGMIANSFVYDEAYISFRIPHKTLNCLFKQKKHNFITSTVSPIIKDKYLFILKINEARLLPSHIRSKIKDEKTNVCKVLLTVNINEKYEVDDSCCYRERHLEEDLYRNYVPNSYNFRNVVVYQWLEEKKKRKAKGKGKNHYYFHVKIENSKMLPLSLFLYILLLILMNLLCNIFHVLVFEAWTNTIINHILNIWRVISLHH